MTIDMIPDVAMSALVLASLYALIGLGWVIIFRATKVLNFAVGQLLALGTFGFFWLASTLGLPFLVAVPAAVLLIAVLGVVGYFALLRPLAGEPPFSSVVLTMGLAIVLTSVMAMVWGTGSRVLNAPIQNNVYVLPGDAVITTFGAATVVAAILAFAGVLAFFRFSRLGIQMRAAAEMPLLGSQIGININMIFAVAWAMAAALVTLAGLSYAYTNVLQLSLTQLGLRGLAPALVGGLDSVKGVAVGALLVAGVESVSVVYWGGAVKDAAAFAVLLAVLVIRPYGLFGTPEIRRV